MDTSARFRRTLQKIPAPEFYVFYNGTDNFPEQQELYLKDAFIADEKGKDFPLDLRVMVYNLNKPTYYEIQNQCPHLPPRKTSAI